MGCDTGGGDDFDAFAGVATGIVVVDLVDEDFGRRRERRHGNGDAKQVARGVTDGQRHAEFPPGRSRDSSYPV